MASLVAEVNLIRVDQQLLRRHLVVRPVRSVLRSKFLTWLEETSMVFALLVHGLRCLQSHEFSLLESNRVLLKHHLLKLGLKMLLHLMLLILHDLEVQLELVETHGRQLAHRLLLDREASVVAEVLEIDMVDIIGIIEVYLKLFAATHWLEHILVKLRRSLSKFIKRILSAKVGAEVGLSLLKLSLSWFDLVGM